MRSPFRWAGGKRQLLKEISKYIPEFDQYYEPFCGGAALYWFLAPEKAFLSDSNGELINAYKAVQGDVEGLIGLLSKYPNEESFYYDMRALDPKLLDPIPRAARFVYLNKTCFNGLYRTNRKGVYNTPYGHLKNPLICDEQTLRACNKALKGTTLTATYFQNVLSEKLPKNSFVYLDPPYVPVDQNSFVSYSKKGFGIDQHELLAKTVERLDKEGTKVLMSNSDTDWCRERYKDFTIIEVQGRRSINSNGKGRGKVGELLIKNY